MVLGRNYKQRKHLFKTLLTQLIQHQRITTTHTKAHHLQRYAQRIILHAKRSSQGISAGTLQLNRYLTTQVAKKKATLELSSRYKDQTCNFTRVSKVQYRRRGDNAPMATIEYRGNEFEKFDEKRREEEERDGHNVRSWKKRFLVEQRQWIQAKLNEAGKEENKKADVGFLEAKLKDLDFELRLEEKGRKTPPIYREFL